MGYRFIIPHSSAGPSEGALVAAGAQYRRLSPGDANGVIAWRGRTTRGVFVFEQEGNTHIKLPSLASDDDAELATELAVRHALARDGLIDAEEPHTATPRPARLWRQRAIRERS